MPCVVVSVEELRMSIERRLENLSGEAERLRAALEALGPGAPVPAAPTIDRTLDPLAGVGERQPRPV
ncbi:MAG: hypothetical protein ACLPZR_24465 [Solirubrobacteraceae bacterium]